MAKDGAKEEAIDKIEKETYGVEAETGDYTWLSKPAVFSDYCAVGVWGKVGLVRFAFCEWLANGTEPLVRAGIVMPIADAKILAEEVLKLIEDQNSLPSKENVSSKDA